MLENIKGGDFSRPGLRVCADIPGLFPLLSAISTDRTGGVLLRRNISAIGEIMGRDWRSENSTGGGGAIIGIPRSGTPLSNGLQAAFPGYAHMLSNDGGTRDEGQPILPHDLVLNEPSILIADSVIVTGTTVALTLSAALSRARSVKRIVVFSAFAAIDGVENLFDVFPGIEINIGAFAPTRRNWDTHRWRTTLTLSGIPNFGELVSRP
jgi:hypothetical protein